MENIATMTPDAIVKKADEVALLITKDQLKTGQIRNFYSSITRMRTDLANKGENENYMDGLKRDITMLKPKLAYAAGRQKAVRANFYPVMKEAIDGVIKSGYSEAAFENFFMFAESIVAYHKFHGGE